jgi:ankyrin repeat protein
MSLDNQTLVTSLDDGEESDTIIKVKVLQRVYKVNKNEPATKFHVACARGNLEEVKFCIENDFDINLKILQSEIANVEEMETFFPHSAWTGFDFALFEGHQNIVQFLQNVNLVQFVLNFGLREQLHSCHLMDCFEYICEISDYPMMKYFILHENITVDRHIVRGSKALEIIQLLACQNGSLEIMEFLIQRGMFDRNVTNYFGKTGFHLACEGGKLNVVKWFAHHRMDLELLDDLENTGFYKASKNGHLNIVKWFCERGIISLEFNINYRRGFSAACSSSHFDIIQFFPQLI